MRLLTQLEVAHEILMVADGSEALLLLSQEPPVTPTLVLLDVNMPELDGIGFLEQFQQLPTSQQVATRIVLLTTAMTSRDLLRVNELPIAGLVSKPLTREKVDALLRLHFQRELPATQGT